MNLKERLRWWSRAARSRGADLKKAEARQAHFDKVGKQAHNAWVKAKKNHNAPEATKQKARARRAAKRSAFWHEQADDLRDGYEKAVKRREAVKKHIAERRRQRSDVPAQGGFVVPDRVWNPSRLTLCGWFVPINDEAREKGWRGVLVSGCRTVAHSIELCEARCGAPSCPGTCAGASSNHNATSCEKPQGAEDLTDYYTFAAIMRQMGNPIFNDLPADRVHFSASGH